MFLPAGVLESFGLVLTRTSAFILMSPILGFGRGFSGYKIALIFVLSVVLYVALAEPLPGEVEPVVYGAMMLRELLVGLFLGLFLHLALLVVRVAGEMIGHEMGFLMARQVDPASGLQSTLIGSVYEILFLLTFLLLNGHHVLMRSLDASFDRAPIGAISVSENLGTTVLEMFTAMFSAGIVFAAPVMLLLMLVSTVIGLLSRAVPTLNVMEVGFSLRVGVSLTAMFLFVPLLEPAMTRLQGQFIDWLGRGLDALG